MGMGNGKSISQNKIRESCFTAQQLDAGNSHTNKYICFILDQKR